MKQVFALSLAGAIPNSCGVYEIRTRCGRFKYIGSTKFLRDRYCHHLRDLVNGDHNNKSLQAIFYQKNTVIFFKVLKRCQPHQLIRIEQNFLNKAILAKSVYCLNRKKKSGSGH